MRNLAACHNFYSVQSYNLIINKEESGFAREIPGHQWIKPISTFRKPSKHWCWREISVQNTYKLLAKNRVYGLWTKFLFKKQTFWVLHEQFLLYNFCNPYKNIMNFHFLHFFQDTKEFFFARKTIWASSSVCHVITVHFTAAGWNFYHRWLKLFYFKFFVLSTFSLAVSTALEQNLFHILLRRL